MATIKIINWDKFNPRKDVKSPSWFRLDHGLFENPDFYSFSHTEICVLIYLLSIASKKNSDTFQVNYQHVERIGRFKVKEFDAALEKLSAIQVVLVDVTDTSRARNADVTDTNATNEQTNITNMIADRDFDFEILYKKYPRRVGKTEGIKRAKNQIKSLEAYQELSTAIDRYSNYCVAQRTEPKFIKHFSTFMMGWREWLDPEAGGSHAEPKLQPRDLEAL